MNCVWIIKKGKMTCVKCGRSVKSSDRQLKAVCKASRGLGDTIAKLTSAVGIKPCGGCKERQQKLNELFPY